MTIEVHDDQAATLYQAAIDGDPAGRLVYARHGNRVALLHTVVEPAFRGRGVAAQLVEQALDDLRSQGNTVTVYCPYVISFLLEHPGYVDLVDRDQPGHFRA